jgi:hypothetical protein
MARVPRQRGSRGPLTVVRAGAWTRDDSWSGPRKEPAQRRRREGRHSQEARAFAVPQLAQGELRALPPEETIAADQTKEPKTLTLPLLSVIDYRPEAVSDLGPIT